VLRQSILITVVVVGVGSLKIACVQVDDPSTGRLFLREIQRDVQFWEDRHSWLRAGEPPGGAELEWFQCVEDHECVLAVDPCGGYWAVSRVKIALVKRWAKETPWHCLARWDPSPVGLNLVCENRYCHITACREGVLITSDLVEETRGWSRLPLSFPLGGSEGDKDKCEIESPCERKGSHF